MNQCACSPQMENLYHDSDPIRLMELLFELTNLGNQEGLLTSSDRNQLLMLNELVASVAKKQRSDQQLKISS